MLIAPFHTGNEFFPVLLRRLERQAGQAAELVAGVFDHIAQDQAEVDGLAGHEDLV